MHLFFCFILFRFPYVCVSCSILIKKINNFVNLLNFRVTQRGTITIVGTLLVTFYEMPKVFMYNIIFHARCHFNCDCSFLTVQNPGNQIHLNCLQSLQKSILRFNGANLIDTRCFAQNVNLFLSEALIVEKLFKNGEVVSIFLR